MPNSTPKQMRQIQLWMLLIAFVALTMIAVGVLLLRTGHRRDRDVDHVARGNDAVVLPRSTDRCVSRSIPAMHSPSSSRCDRDARQPAPDPARMARVGQSAGGCHREDRDHQLHGTHDKPVTRKSTTPSPAEWRWARGLAGAPYSL